MIAFINGQFLPENEAKVSIFDRSFLYGDGLFETIRIYQGKPFRWAQHLARLQSGADFLRIALPFTPAELAAYAVELLRQAEMASGLLRFTLSRGTGQRGYSPRCAQDALVVMALRALDEPEAAVPRQWRLMTSTFRARARDVLCQFKTCNKLSQVLARAEAEACGADEALLLNDQGHVAESSSANVFWIQGETVHTPSLQCGALPGVTRAAVLELCAQSGMRCAESASDIEVLAEADGVFLTLSSFGIVEAVGLDQAVLNQSPITRRLFTTYCECLKRETDSVNTR
jgi:aminodeoxychorismate lyase